MTDSKTYEDEFSELWTYVALVYGWNEIAKNQPTLEQKVFCRGMRALAQKTLRDTGKADVLVPDVTNVLEENQANPIVLLIGAEYMIPGLEFRESDIELMRAALAKHDADAALKASGRG